MTISAGGTSPVFFVNSNVTASFTGLTIAEGSTNDNGGAQNSYEA